MIRYTLGVLGERTAHPLLAGLVLLGGLIFLVAFVAERALDGGLLPGFLTVYAIMAAALGVLGFVLFAVAHGLARVRRRYDVTWE